MADRIERYSAGARINHWAVALLFVCAALTGLAFFHPVFYFLVAPFGGGSWARVLHPFFGVLMAAGFAGLFARLWRDNVWRQGDSDWVGRAPELLKGNAQAMPAVGRYNAGQKIVFWLFALCLLLLLVTGFMFWRPWFADLVPIALRRVAVVLHAFSALVLILGAIVHIYAAIWVKGSLRAMTRGSVSAAWARAHHLLWYQQLGRGK